jgi:hypothetical protein
VELRSTLAENELDKIVCEAAEAVAVGNVHRAYSSRKHVRQKPAQGRAVEVDAAGDVAVDGGAGMARLEGLDLAPEILRLLAGGHSGVDGGLVAGLCGRGRFPRRCLPAVGGHGGDVEEPVTSTLGACVDDGVEEAALISAASLI